MKFSKKILILCLLFLSSFTFTGCSLGGIWEDIKNGFNDAVDYGEGLLDKYADISLKVDKNIQLSSDGKKYSDYISFDKYFYVSLRFAIISDRDTNKINVDFNLAVSDALKAKVEYLSGPLDITECDHDVTMYNTTIKPSMELKYIEFLFKINCVDEQETIVFTYNFGKEVLSENDGVCVLSIDRNNVAYINVSKGHFISDHKIYARGDIAYNWGDLNYEKYIDVSIVFEFDNGDLTDYVDDIYIVFKHGYNAKSLDGYSKIENYYENYDGFKLTARSGEPTSVSFRIEPRFIDINMHYGIIYGPLIPEYYDDFYYIELMPDKNE